MKRSSLQALRQFAKHHSAATRRTSRGLMFGAAVALLQVTSSVHAQTAYTWTSSSTGGAWTTVGNWTPATGYPGQNAGDTAGLTDASANRDITLGTSLTIAGLTYAETLGFTNELEIDQNGSGTITLTNSNATALALGGSGVTGTELLYLNGTGASGVAAYSGAINLATNGVLELGSNSNTGYSKVTGAVTVNSGGALNVDQTISTSSGTPTIAGALTVNSGGVVSINHANNPVVVATVSGTDTRFNVTGSLLVNGTIQSSSTTVLLSSGVNGPTAAHPSSELYLSGAITSAQFNSTATLTNLGTTGSGGIVFVGTSLGTSTASPGFTLSSDAQLPGVSFQSSVASGSTAFITLGTVNASTLNMAGLYYSCVAGATEEFTLASNLTINGSNTGTTTLNSDTNDPFHDNNSVNGTIILNVNGKTIDTTANLRGFTTFGAYSYNITGGGTIKSTFFSFASTGPQGTSAGGGGITFQAVGGTATANNLGNTVGGTIDPTSTFYYTGAGTSASPATLTSNRAIGALTVGNGTAASNLQLVTTGLTVAGNVTVANTSTLQLGAQILTFTSGANLTGTGTVAGTTAGAASSGTLMFSGTGGIVPGTNGTVGALTLTGTQTATLGSNSTSLFDIASASSADHLGLNGTITITYAGTLALNFLNGYTPASGTMIQIADADTNAGGSFANITSNLSGDTFSFAPLTGELTISISTVPEPATMVQAGLLISFIFGAEAWKRIKRQRAGTC